MVADPTCTGLVRLSVVPSPNWPYAFWPQAHIVPFARVAALWASPAETELHVVRPLTRRGLT